MVYLELSITDPDGKAFPWSNANRVDLKSLYPALQNVVDHKGVKTPPHLLRGKVTGLYFSGILICELTDAKGSWCGPCQGFTPVLRNTYKLLKSQNKEFEIIFVSSGDYPCEFALTRKIGTKNPSANTSKKCPGLPFPSGKKWTGLNWHRLFK